MKLPIIILSILTTIAPFALSAENTGDTKSAPAVPNAPTKTEDEKAMDELEHANELIGQEKYAEAERAYTALRAKKVSKTVWAKASNNLGITLRLQKKYADSIKVFEEILNSDVNDRDPGGSLMETFRNYRYNACKEIALCHVRAGDYPKALAAIRLTKTKYKFEADCATCAKQSAEDIARREKWLENKVAETDGKTPKEPAK